jgi:hypothetical protein
MDGEQQKAEQFIGRLLANPALKGLNPLTQERQIRQFLKANREQLAPTLASTDFFPDKNWVEVFTLLSKVLRGLIDRDLLEHVSAIVDGIDFAFLSFFTQSPTPSVQAQEELVQFQKQILQKDDVRTASIGPLIVFRYEFLERYLEEIFRRRNYIYFELTKVQKLKMSKEQVKSFIESSLLLRSAIHLVDNGGSTGSPNSATPEFVERMLPMLKKQLGSLPESLLRSGLNSNISFLEDSSTETTARLVAIFSLRCQDYKPMAKIDRGADSPDKSWLSVARRNYKFYGFDIMMLDELYKIAGENGW